MNNVNELLQMNSSESLIYLKTNQSSSIEQVYKKYPEIECDKSIRSLIKPCDCKYIVSRLGATNGTVKTIAFFCIGKSLDDIQASSILKIFLTSDLNRNRTRIVDLKNNRLTKVPIEIAQFKRLEQVKLVANQITSLESGWISMGSSTNNKKLVLLDLSQNLLNRIEAGAFEGRYSVGSIINLENNYLTRFESAVFQPVMEQFFTYGGSPYTSIGLGNS